MIAPKLVNIHHNLVDIHSATLKDTDTVYSLLKDKDNCYYQFDLNVTGKQSTENLLRLAEKTWNMYGHLVENRDFMLVAVLKDCNKPLGVVWLHFNRDVTEMTIKWVCAKEYKHEPYMKLVLSMLIDLYISKFKSLRTVTAIVDGRSRTARGLLESLNFTGERLNSKEIIYKRKFVKIG